MKREELETAFDAKDERALAEAEEIIDRVLIQRWEPGMAQLPITLREALREKVNRELQRRYAAAGWLVKFEHHDDQRDGSFDVAIFSACGPAESER